MADRTTYELGCLKKPKGTKDIEKIRISTTDLIGVIKRYSSRTRCAILFIIDFTNNKTAYYNYKGNKVFYFPKLKRYVTEEEYQEWKAKQ